jgi:hypothetical protein
MISRQLDSRMYGVKSMSTPQITIQLAMFSQIFNFNNVSPNYQKLLMLPQ